MGRGVRGKVSVFAQPLVGEGQWKEKDFAITLRLIMEVLRVRERIKKSINVKPIHAQVIFIYSFDFL